MAGIEQIPLRIPERWDPVWFEGFVREVLAKADARNAIAGLGINIEGTPDTPATISSNTDVDQLVDENYILAEESPLLPNARTLDGEGGVIEVNDSGPGGIVRISVAAHGITYSKFRLGRPCSVVGRPSNSIGEQTSIEATSDKTVLCCADDELAFRGLSDVLDFVGSAADGDMLVRVDGEWTRLPAGNDGEVLMMVDGVPTWVAPPWAPADATFLTSDDETTDLPNSRKLVAGTDISIDTSTPGEIEISTP